MPNNAPSKNPDPLGRVWRTFSLLLSIVGFSSLVQDGLKHLFAWRGFISAVIESYRSVRNFIVDFLLGWLPFSIPDFVVDYLFVGFIVSVALDRVFREIYNEEMGHMNWPEGLPKPRRPLISHPDVFYAFWAWPIVFLLSAQGALQAYKLSKLGIASWDETARAFGPRALTFRWIAAILLGCVILLATNAFLPNTLVNGT